LETARARYTVGRSMAVCPGRGKHAVGRVVLLHIERVARAYAISDEDATWEGFTSPDAFRQVWVDLYDRESLGRPCWSLAFSPLIGFENLCTIWCVACAPKLAYTRVDQFAPISLARESMRNQECEHCGELLPAVQNRLYTAAKARYLAASVVYCR
jgi:hypothetical protein